MFHDIPAPIRARMKYLEELDEADRSHPNSTRERLRQIPPETGKYLAVLLAGAPRGTVLEIGTSAGYSTLWLSLACRVTGATITTFESLPEKIKLARETVALCGLQPIVRIVEGDARMHLPEYSDISYCFLDAEKEVYAECYELVVPRLVPGGLLVADNAVSHRDALQDMLHRALTDERVDALVVPIGKGVLTCRRN